MRSIKSWGEWRAVGVLYICMHVVELHIFDRDVASDSLLLHIKSKAIQMSTYHAFKETVSYLCFQR